MHLSLELPLGEFAYAALAFISKEDEERFLIHKLQYVEHNNVAAAVQCMKNLRSLSFRYDDVSRRGDLSAMGRTKRARTFRLAE